MNDLLYVQGQDNLAGIVGEIYMCPVDDIASVPALAAATSLKTVAAGNIVNKSTKKFSRIYCTDETAKIEVKTVGERDGRGRESMLTFRFPALGVALADFIADAQNTPVVIIYRSAKDGKLYLLGVSRLDKTLTALSMSIPCYFESAENASGEKRADQNGALLGWKFTCAHDPIEYVGAIPLTPAV